MDKKDYHHLIDHREPPASLVALRNELLKFPRISVEAMKGRSFEECLGIIAARLSIVLDGMYDPEKVCDMLYWELKRLQNPAIGKFPGLSGAKLVETADAITLESTDLIVPEAVRQEQVAAALATSALKKPVETPGTPKPFVKAEVAAEIEKSQEPAKKPALEIFGVTTLIPTKSGCYVVGMEDGKEYGVYYNHLLNSFTDSPIQYTWSDVISIREMIAAEEKAYNDSQLDDL